LLKFVVGFDGSAGSKRALDFAVAAAQAQDAGIVLAHVLEWSPYSFLTPQEVEERHVRRKEELERAESALVAPVVKALSAKGAKVESVMRYGHVADTLAQIVKEFSASQIFIGRAGQSELASRVFGSVAGSLAQSSPVPCTIVP